MRRLVFWAAVVATVAAAAWWLPYFGSVSVPLFFGGCAVALLVVTSRGRRGARKSH